MYGDVMSCGVLSLEVLWSFRDAGSDDEERGCEVLLSQDFDEVGRVGRWPIVKAVQDQSPSFKSIRSFVRTSSPK